jgi:hypothetical protein
MAKSIRKARPQAFWERVDHSGECWMWTGATNTRYPVFSLGGRGNMGYAHRYSYELFVGPIPFGYEIDHLCRQPMCVRPDHLEAVTPAENKRRAYTGTCRQGHPMFGDNLWIGPKGDRKCRICAKARWATWSPKRGYVHRHRRPELAVDCAQCIKRRAAA